MATGQDYVGPYRLVSQLRTGASGQVWEAVDATNNRRCALKLLLEEFRKDRSYVSALKKEYEIGREMDHPRVITAFDFGLTDATAYLAMELFNAPNLKQILQQLALQQNSEALDPLLPKIVEEMAEGLEYLNSKGYIHRDIKPHNYLVDEHGDTKLIDFSLAIKVKSGLGKMFGGKPKVQGTRSYMAPEQVRGQHLDVRTDVYGFGCTVHELFTGKPPFTGHTSNDLLKKHLRAAPPSIEGANQNVTPEFAGLVLRCLAKTPEKRPQNMSEFLTEFRAMKVYKDQPETSTR